MEALYLRHLDIIGTDLLNEMPKEMSRLGSLQTLSNFVVSKKSGLIVKELMWGVGFCIFMEHFEFRSCRLWSLLVFRPLKTQLD